MNKDFNIFVAKVVEMIQEAYPDSQVEAKVVTKNNNVKLTGLCIHKNEGIYPTLYLESFYEKYEEPEEAVQSIITAYENAKVKGMSGFDMDFIKNYSEVKKNLRVKLVNKASNEIELDDMVYMDFMDLAVVAYYVFADDNSVFSGQATTVIRKNFTHLWDIAEDQVISDAINNTLTSLNVSIDPIGSVLRDMMGFSEDEEAFSDIPDAFYVCRAGEINGAVAMIFQDVLTDFANKLGCDLYILPSSIHEVLLVPVINGPSMDDLTNMVREVNGSELLTQDILSDHAYYYSMTDGYRFNF